MATDRIRELELQAYVERETAWTDPTSNMIIMVMGKEFSREKFAELIIRDCIDAIDLDYSAHDDQHDSLIELRAHQAARRMIKQHFGIE